MPSRRSVLRLGISGSVLAVSDFVTGGADTSFVWGDPEWHGEKRKIILALGDSITSAHGLRSCDSYVSHVQSALDQPGSPYAGQFRLANAGHSGDTTARGLHRLERILKYHAGLSPAAAIIELGGNDFFKRVPVEQTRENLLHIIERLREENVNTRILIAGFHLTCEAKQMIWSHPGALRVLNILHGRRPPDLSDAALERFGGVFEEVARRTGASLVPYVMKGVDTKHTLDGVHPDVDGQKIVAANILDRLKPILNAMTVRGSNQSMTRSNSIHLRAHQNVQQPNIIEVDLSQ